MKTLVTDLDGTLLVHGTIDDRVLQLLKRFQKKKKVLDNIL